MKELRAALKEKFPDFKITSSRDKENDTFSFKGRRGRNEGFDIDIEEKQAVISNASNMSAPAMYGAIGLTIILTLIFGDSILVAIGLGGIDAGTVKITLKIFYMIPLLIFLIPSMILAMFVGRMLTKKDPALLGQVTELVRGMGLEIESEE